MKVLIYTHDTFGLGNIRRMLAIGEYLNQNNENISILMVSGSPMLHSFRLDKAIDYVKLPTITRDKKGEYQSRSLDLSLEKITRMRANLILSSVIDFQPDVILVDKKPLGLKKELLPTLRYCQQLQHPPEIHLVLRDILDEAETTRRFWKAKNYFNSIDRYFTKILVMGDQRIYDLGAEYCFPESCREKIRYCGYISRSGVPQKNPAEIRQQAELPSDKKLLLVTVGGGQDGYAVLKAFLQYWQNLPLGDQFHAVVIHGPELKPHRRERLLRRSRHSKQLTLLEFTQDLPALINTAEAVICMGGYNTLCEAIGLQKRILCIPRTTPVLEQLIRASRFAEQGLLHFIHPEKLSASSLSRALPKLFKKKDTPAVTSTLSLNGLGELNSFLNELPSPKESPQKSDIATLFFPVHAENNQPRQQRYREYFLERATGRGCS